MSSAATKKNAQADPNSSVKGNWKLLAGKNNPNLGVLYLMEITEQLPDGDHDEIFGSVQTIEPVTAYALLKGSVVGNTVSFQLSVGGIGYHFQGTMAINPVGQKTLSGLVSWPSLASGDGSWSAQAQSGPNEDEQKCPDTHTTRALNK